MKSRRMLITERILNVKGSGICPQKNRWVQMPGAGWIWIEIEQARPVCPQAQAQVFSKKVNEPGVWLRVRHRFSKMNERTPLGLDSARGASYHPKSWPITPFTILSTKSHLMTPQMPKSLQFLPSKSRRLLHFNIIIYPSLHKLYLSQHYSILYIRAL